MWSLECGLMWSLESRILWKLPTEGLRNALMYWEPLTIYKREMSCICCPAQFLPQLHVPFPLGQVDKKQCCPRLHTWPAWARSLQGWDSKSWSESSFVPHTLQVPVFWHHREKRGLNSVKLQKRRENFAIKLLIKKVPTWRLLICSDLFKISSYRSCMNWDTALYVAANWLSFRAAAINNSMLRAIW